MDKITFNYSTEVGDKVIIWITGDANLYIAEVTQQEPTLVLKVTEDGPYSRLKPGDYIIKEYYTSIWQSGQDGANKILQNGIDSEYPLVSGLKSLNVPDGKLHVIGPYYE